MLFDPGRVGRDFVHLDDNSSFSESKSNERSNNSNQNANENSNKSSRKSYSPKNSEQSSQQGNQNQMFRVGDKISVYAPLTDVAPVIGASAGKIKKNEVICGVTGTYEGGETVEPEENDVNFYNYDGTRLYAYTKQEFLALNEFPANPVNEGMTSQGWNWDYQKAVNYVTEYGILDVGESCVTSDGKTKIYIHLPVDNLQPVVGLIINGTITIDWGDNTTPDTVTNNNNNVINTQHTYENAGDYVITISLVGSNSKIALSGALYDGGYLFHGNSTNNETFYRNCVQKIELGTIANYGTNCLGWFGSLKSVNVPYVSGVKMGGLMAYQDYKLKMLVLPKNHTKFSSTICITNNSTICLFSSEFNDFGSNSFTVGNYRVTIPENTFVSNTNQGFYSHTLGGIIVPKTLTTFGNGIYGGGLTYIDCSHFTQVPTLNSATYMSGSSYLNPDCKIIVPDSLYEDWIVANNWSTIASKIISKSDWDNL